MEYLTLKISSATRGPIYEKDFTVTDVFGSFVRVLVSQMVKIGLLKDKERYWSAVAPGYDDQAQFNKMIWEKADGGNGSENPGEQWLTILLDHKTKLDAPIRYFTLELHTLPPDARLYRKDFPMSDVEYLTDRVKGALVKMSLIGADEAIESRLCARSGDSPRFNQETIHALRDELSALQIRVESAPREDTFAERPMPTCSCGHGGEQRDQQLVIFFRKGGLEDLAVYVKQNASRRKETGGILIGQVYRAPDDGRLHLEIENFIAAEQAQADAVSLRFTHETFQALRAEKQKRFSDTKRIVGWYHTHPPLPVSVGDRKVTTSFFSSDDLAVHRQIFNKPWQVAMVLDAESSERVFFRWEGDKVVESGFHVSE